MSNFITAPSASTATIYGSYWSDSLKGGAGDDIFDGRGGSDSIDGGAGADVALFSAASSNFTVTTLLGLTKVYGAWSSGVYAYYTATLRNVETLAFSDKTLTVNGATPTIISGTRWSDSLTGGSGDDIFDPMGGGDTIVGGAGSDTALFFANSSLFTVTSLGGVTKVTGTWQAGDYAYSTVVLRDVETLKFADRDISLSSSSKALIEGTIWSDKLTGTSADEQFDGKGGDDDIDGGGGSDTALIFAASAAFTIVTLSGVTKVKGGWQAGDYAYDTLKLRNVETLQFSDRAVSLSTDGGNVLSGSRWNDSLSGTSGADVFDGMGGNDLIDGGAGADAALFFANSAAFTITTLGGVTKVSGGGQAGDYAYATATLRNVETLQFADRSISVDTAAAPVIEGTMWSEKLIGSTVDEQFDGKGGDDLIDGGGGNDTALFFANRAAFTVTTLEGVTAVSGNYSAGAYAYDTARLTNVEKIAFNDATAALTTTAANVVFGTSYADTLTGSSGDDVFDPRGGADSIVGGGGNDTVVIFAPRSQFDITNDAATGAAKITGGWGVWPYSQTITLEGVRTARFTDTTAALIAAGLEISAPKGSAGESGLVTSYTVRLTVQPKADVRVTIGGDADVSPDKSELTFTTANWSQAQTVVVSAVNDADVEGAHAGVLTHRVSSADAEFAAIKPRTVSVAVEDNDTSNVNSIRGRVWFDRDGDRLRDGDEANLTGWSVFIDANRNGKLDAGEQSAHTAADGSYALLNVATGTHRVGVVLPTGWRQTHPSAAGSGSVALTTTGSDEKIVTQGAIVADSYRADGVVVDVSGDAPAAKAAAAADGVYSAAEMLTRLDKFQNDPRFSGIDGKGYAVAVLDTGIDLNHPFFGPDANGDGTADRIVFQKDFTGGSSADDVQGHGTHVSSIIASSDATYSGVAPKADIVALQVLGDSGSGSMAGLEQGLRWVVDNAVKYNIAVVNMSLGFATFDTARVKDKQISDELAALAAMGVTVVSASGNSFGSGSRQGVAYPSSDLNSLSVGAVFDSNIGRISWSTATAYSSDADRVAPFSQRDDQLTDIMSPGVQIEAAARGGGTVKMSGTSMAAPFMAGVALLAQQTADKLLGRHLTLDELRTLLANNSKIIKDGDDEDDSVVNTGLSFPRVDVFALGEAVAALSAPGFHSVTVTNSQTVTDIDFGALAMDSAQGGQNSEVLIGSALGDYLVGSSGADKMRGLAGDDVLIGADGNDTLEGGVGVDYIDGGSGADWAEVGGQGGSTTSVTGVETLIGGLSADWINLGSGGGKLIMAAVETLIGGAGADWIELGARGSTMIMAAVETLIGGAGADFIRLGDRGGTMIMAAVETLIGGRGDDRIALGARGGMLVLTAIETLIGGSGADYIRLGDRGNAMILTGIETLVGGSGSDLIRLGDQGNTFIMAAIETLTGGAGVDRIALGDRGGALSVSGVEALIGGGGADNVAISGGGVWFHGRGGADRLTLVNGAYTDVVAFGATSDGAAVGASSGWDEIYNFNAGADYLQITDDLRALVDRDGDRTADSAVRGTNGVSLVRDEVIALSATVSSLADADFAAFRTALGSVATDGAARSALVVGADGANSALYLVSDNGDGAIGASEVRLLAHFNSAVIGGNNFVF